MPTPFVEVASGTFAFAHATDPGRTGKNNEDNYALFECSQMISVEDGSVMPAQVAVVADGIGGSLSGEIASQLAIDTFVVQFKQDADLRVHDRLDSAIYHANRAIYTEGRATADRKGMGTTVVAAVVVDNYLYLAHAGDSRAYLIRNGQIYLLTLDHTWVQEAIDANYITLETALHHPNRNVIKRFLGPLERVEIDHRVLAVENRTHDVRLPQFRQLAEDDRLALLPGDTVLLCSDGLNDAIPDEEILQIVLRNHPQQAARELIRAANAAGGPDNITVLLLQQPGEAMPIVGEPIDQSARTQIWQPMPAIEAADVVQGATAARKRAPLAMALVVGALLLIGAGATAWGMGLFDLPGTLSTSLNVTPASTGVLTVAQTPTQEAEPTSPPLVGVTELVTDSVTGTNILTSSVQPSVTMPISSSGADIIISSTSQSGINVQVISTPGLSLTSDISPTVVVTVTSVPSATVVPSATALSTVSATLDAPALDVDATREPVGEQDVATPTAIGTQDPEIQSTAVLTPTSTPFVTTVPTLTPTPLLFPTVTPNDMPTVTPSATVTPTAEVTATVVITAASLPTPVAPPLARSSVIPTRQGPISGPIPAPAMLAMLPLATENPPLRSHGGPSMSGLSMSRL